MELAMLLGLIIVITMIVFYNMRKNSQKYTKKTRYFDNYYDVPQLNALLEDPDMYNKQVVNIRLQPRLMDETNSQASRWAGSMESQPETDDCQRHYTNTDRESDTTHGLNPNKKHKSYSETGFKSIVNKFMDSDLFDEQFIMNNKYDSSIKIESMETDPRYIQEDSQRN